jgi:hypothetical protein
LNSPFLTVAVKFEGGEQEERDERVSFGRAGESVYITVPGQPGAARIDTAKLAEANKALDELLK